MERTLSAALAAAQLQVSALAWCTGQHRRAAAASRSMRIELRTTHAHHRAHYPSGESSLKQSQQRQPLIRGLPKSRVHARALETANTKPHIWIHTRTAHSRTAYPVFAFSSDLIQEEFLA
jgi:hypothetical protein